MKNVLNVCKCLILYCAACEVRAVSAQRTAGCVLGCTVVTVVVVAAIYIRAGSKHDTLCGRCAVRPVLVNDFASSWVRRVGNLGPLRARVIDY